MTQDGYAGRETLPSPEARAGSRRPPPGAPNVVVVLVDDMGFGAPSAFGGPCEMPVAERLAEGGLRYSRFHTTALCSPTRQSLLTGRNHHAVNMGTITNFATGEPGYTSVRPESAATLAQTLRLNGYNTAAFGKMHQTPVWETSPSGPFDRWPTGEGFEKFYGFLDGETNQWAPTLVEDASPVETPDDPDCHFSEDVTNRAIGWVRSQRSLTPDKPFFLYLPFGATHAPHHVPDEWIQKYRGRFDHGWDKEREEILRRQKALGVVPPDCRLSARHEEIPAWDELTDDGRAAAAGLMEVYAAFAEHTDHQVGRLVDALEEIGALDDTLFLYITGDNGASGEGGVHGTLNELASLNGVQESPESVLAGLAAAGTPMAYNHYPVGWAHAMNAPYQWTKQVASHWGGTRDGLVVHWPRGIAARGEVRDQFHHIIDVVPTVLEAASLPHPVLVNGVRQQPVDGVSMAYSFDDPASPGRRTTQYFEMLGNRGIYHEGWSAGTRHATPWKFAAEELPAFEDDRWELYAPDDWSQAENLAASHPEKLHELQELFLVEATKNGVLPLDDRRAERFVAETAGRPDLLAGRNSVTLYPGMSGLRENTVPNLKNRSFAVTAEIVVPEGGAGGAILAHGGRFGGWVIFLEGGAPAHHYNWFGRERYSARAAEPLTPGEHTLRYEFTYDGGGVGKGGDGALYVDGEKVATARVERTIPFLLGEPTDVGRDGATPVVEQYRTPGGRFTGDIRSVRLDVGDDAHDDPVGRLEAAARRQ